MVVVEKIRQGLDAAVLRRSSGIVLGERTVSSRDPEESVGQEGSSEAHSVETVPALAPSDTVAAHGARVEVASPRIRRVAGRVYASGKPALRPLAHRIRRYLNADLERSMQEMIRLETNHLAHLLADVKHQLLLEANHLSHLSEVLSSQAALNTNQLDHAIRRSAEANAHGIAASIQQIQAEAESLRVRLDELRDRSLAGLAGLAGRLDDQTAALEHVAQTAERRTVVPFGNGVVMVRTSVGHVLCPSTDEQLIAGLIDTGDVELGTRVFIERLLRPGGCFVDVGANLGMHTLAGARAVGAAGRVVAIEAHPETASLLQRSVTINGVADRVTVHTLGAASSTGTADLFLGRVSGHHSLYGAADEPAIKIELAALDDLVSEHDEVSLIKIDVEGAELEVVRGAQALLARCPGVGLIVEFGPEHLSRAGVDPGAWFDAFEALGMEWCAIEPLSGHVTRPSRREIAQEVSANLFFASPRSGLWEAVDG